MWHSRAAAALKAAFPLTLPVMAGFLVLGFSYGVLMAEAGLGPGWTFFTCWLVFAGSMQYVAITLFAAAFDPLYALLVTLTVNARHVFYGLSMLGKLDRAGRFKPYVIFALCDETFSILCAAEPPEGVDPGWFMFLVALLNRWYWILGSLLGALFGGLVDFNTKGLDFALTAMFAVIFLNQWQGKKNRPGALAGLGCSALMLLLVGPQGFVIPAMALILAVLGIVSRMEAVKHGQ